jgi:hypothetical protein
MSLNLADVYLCHTAQGSLTCRTILRHGADGFTFPPKEGVLLICIAALAGVEPVNLGYNGNHATHCTTDSTSKHFAYFVWKGSLDEY